MRRVAHLVALVAASTLALTLDSALVAQSQAAIHDPVGVEQGAGWLESQLTNGLLHNDQYGFDDVGLSIDAALALDAVGGHEGTVGAITDAVAGQIDGYTGTSGEVYSGAVAKAAVLAQLAGRDTANFGGKNLIGTLEQSVYADGPARGRLHDTSSYGDYANTLGQAYAVRALATAGSTRAADAEAFLLQQQCTTGFFRLSFTADKTASDQTCDGDPTSTPDTDATAVAMLELAPEASDPGVQAALDKARSWLLGVQHADGSFGGGTSTEGANANSTGLAAWALGDSPEAEKAATWLRAHQASPVDDCDALKGNVGAIAYDDASYSAGRTNGIQVATQDQWRRASAQALPALADVPAGPAVAPALSGPTSYVRAGSQQTLTTSGVVAGTRLCLTGPSTSRSGTSSGSSWPQTVTLPAGTGNRTYTVRDDHGRTGQATLKALGAKTFTLTRSRYRVRRGRLVTVTASGLAPREPARLYYRGNLVRSGTASTTGTFGATFRVGRRTGIKTVLVTGAFPAIRRGSTTIRVVR